MQIFLRTSNFAISSPFYVSPPSQHNLSSPDHRSLFVSPALSPARSPQLIYIILHSTRLLNDIRSDFSSFFN